MIPKMKRTNTSSAMTSMRAGMADSRAVTITRMRGTELMVRSGRNNLALRNAPSDEEATSSSPRNPATTTCDAEGTYGEASMQ